MIEIKEKHVIDFKRSHRHTNTHNVSTANQVECHTQTHTHTHTIPINKCKSEMKFDKFIAYQIYLAKYI